MKKKKEKKSLLLPQKVQRYFEIRILWNSVPVYPSKDKRKSFDIVDYNDKGDTAIFPEKGASEVALEKFEEVKRKI